MLTSMTGFSFAEANVDGTLIALEIKSYNNRYLDLIVNLPTVFSNREPLVRDWLAPQVARGRVEFSLRLRDSSQQFQVEVNTEAVAAYQRAVGILKRTAGLRGQPSLEAFMALPEVFRSRGDQDPAPLWSVIDQLRPQLLADFQATRRAEGQRLETDIRRQLAILADGRAEIAAQSAQMEGTFRDSLQKKFAELAAEADPNRILSETALLLVRYGINEELVRLDSHLAAFAELLTQTGPVGKKLDFLCQEIGREINTIGSKTTFAAVQQRIVGMKDALENLREQLRNVE